MEFTTIFLLTACVVFSILIFEKERKKEDLWFKIGILGERNKIIEMYRDEHNGEPLPDNFINELDNLSPLALNEFKHLFAYDYIDKDRLVKDLLNGTFEQTLNESMKIDNYHTIREHYRKEK